MSAAGPRDEEAVTGRILLVEDDEDLAEFLVEELERVGHEVRAASRVSSARAALESCAPELVLADMRLPDGTSFELLEALRAAPSPPGFVLVTAFGTVPEAVRALKQGADDFLTKPLDLDHLLLVVARTIRHRRVAEELDMARSLLSEQDFHGIWGKSAPMQRLFHQVRKVAASSGAVLVVGESGTGKELVARALHEEGPRSDGTFLAVNCAGIPPELLESEFFGHTAGAFSGAGSERRGLFASADGGTLFLDEVAEMSPPLQAKLLRVLEEGEVRPVGSDRVRSLDVRIVTATNRILADEVRAGRFRQDLLYRLETFMLEVPPLRDRGGDLDLLVTRFLRRFTEQYGRRVTAVDPEALDRMRRYGFPGNVRELMNVLERAVVFCEGEVIGVRDLPPNLGSETASPVEGGGGLSPHLLPLGAGGAEELPTLREVEDRYLNYVLERVDGNKRRAARLLGIGRRTLYRRLDELRDESS